MVELDPLVQALTGSNDRYAYACLKELLRQGENSDAVFAYFSRFAAMTARRQGAVRRRVLPQQPPRKGGQRQHAGTVV